MRQVVNEFTTSTSQKLSPSPFLLQPLQKSRGSLLLQQFKQGSPMSDFSHVVSAPPGRFEGIARPYSPEDVLRLRGSIPIERTLARRGALRLWELLHEEEP